VIVPPWAGLGGSVAVRSPGDSVPVVAPPGVDPADAGVEPGVLATLAAVAALAGVAALTAGAAVDAPVVAAAALVALAAPAAVVLLDLSLLEQDAASNIVVADSAASTLV
jgi:hypothetical protein